MTLEKMDVGEIRTIQPSRKIYEVLRVLVGILLLMAAALKGHELAVGNVPQESLLASRGLLVCLVVFEFLLAISLISGVWKRLLWSITLICFVTFAAVAGTKAWAGATSCGCFGQVPADPRYTFALDVVVILCLVVFRPMGVSLADSLTTLNRTVRKSFPVLIPFVIAGFVILIVQSFYSQKLFGPKANISVSPSPAYTCVAKQGDIVIAEFAVRNLSPVPIKLVGATTSCGCTTVQNEFPLELGGGAAQTVHVRVVIGSPNANGKFQKSAKLLVDHGGVFPLLVVDAQVSQ